MGVGPSDANARSLVSQAVHEMSSGTLRGAGCPPLGHAHLPVPVDGDLVARVGERDRTRRPVGPVGQAGDEPVERVGVDDRGQRRVQVLGRGVLGVGDGRDDGLACSGALVRIGCPHRATWFLSHTSTWTRRLKNLPRFLRLIPYYAFRRRISNLYSLSMVYFSYQEDSFKYLRGVLRYFSYFRVSGKDIESFDSVRVNIARLIGAGRQGQV